MNPASQDIATYLQGKENLDLTIGENLFIGREPNKPSSLVTIFDVAGPGPKVVMSGTVLFSMPSIQIRVRNIDYRDGWAVINDIKVLLHCFRGTLSGTVYAGISCRQEPALLDYDDGGRVRFVSTFTCQRTQEKNIGGEG